MRCLTRDLQGEGHVPITVERLNRAHDALRDHNDPVASVARRYRKRQYWHVNSFNSRGRLDFPALTSHHFKISTLLKPFLQSHLPYRAFILLLYFLSSDWKSNGLLDQNISTNCRTISTVHHGRVKSDPATEFTNLTLHLTTSNQGFLQRQGPVNVFLSPRIGTNAQHLHFKRSF